MSTKATFKRKSVSLDADLVAKLETEARNEGRSLSNLVNYRLRKLKQGRARLVIKPTAAEKRRHKAVKAGE